ncbi:helix-turn-helix domain-containing protein [Escherichia coli]|uniref:helix-turn-helix domain-containing protein n=3 Tax=Escherichia coli TaxID=562 RepID=UPI0006979805|nr:helix-turn-helix domain-containing protein [Escherichia coli]EFA8566941.1 helix-turn-helix domain-containing protein [Escherichia coli O157]EES0916670.1 helix-turn-helix domain-containing protein [Escherichia coli]EEY3549556.1 helix-turn-helix domain-containing protein [Escherichia coli]EEY3554910.1 helix-turn-helix domain-containing protein [Escherichia coli]EEY3565503.1 helix-turn-helix domain-containing protein [Escherichia coli]
MIRLLTIKEILQYIEDNLDIYNIDIDSLVTRSGYSRRNLQLLFKRFVGMPVGKYIRLRRVSRSAVLLRLTNLPLSVISTTLCYDSQQTFTREFKKHTGYTPKQYRENKVWVFHNISGPLTVNPEFESPDFYYFDCEMKKIFADLYVYKGMIPYTINCATKRWDRIEKLLSHSLPFLIISNEVYQGQKRSEDFIIESKVWKEKTRDNNSFLTLKKGLYAGFKFTGTKQQYIHFINHIYMNVLGFYGLNRLNGGDIEIIEKHNQKEGEYFFEYYMPVVSDSFLVSRDKLPSLGDIVKISSFLK